MIVFTICYIGKRCSFRCSFTSNSPVCNRITSRWVASKNAACSLQYHSNSTNSKQIIHWRMEGEWASKTASFTYISYCDTITTKILNWRQSTELAKMRLCSMLNTAIKLWVYVQSGYQTRQDRAVWLLNRSGTEPKCFCCPNLDCWQVTRTHC